MNDRIAELDAVAQAELVAQGEVTPLELVDAALERIERMEPLVHAVATLDAEGARERAASAPAGPFRGVPTLLKDLISYPGMRTSAGSRLLAGNVPADGTPYTDHIDAAGLVVLGKTTTSEFGLLGSTETLLEGVTRNPWNPEYSAAGSSGGAAAAVASGMVPLAHASDGGGSVRIPAAVCGLFGLKPSRGRLLPSSPFESPLTGLSSDHCISRSVRDSALFLSVTERTGADAAFAPVGYVREPAERRLRIGMYTTAMLGHEAGPSVRAAVESTASLCRELGHTVEETTFPFLAEELRDAFFAVAGAAVDGVATVFEPLLGRPVGEDDLEPFTLELLAWYREQPADTLQAAFAAMATRSEEFLRLFDAYDVLLTPTLAGEPWPIGHLSPTLDRVTLVDRTKELVGYTPIVNMAGATAMSVPLTWTDDGLPIGSHFIAAPGEEARLLSLAYELEEASPWAKRWAPLSYITTR